MAERRRRATSRDGGEARRHTTSGDPDANRPRRRATPRADAGTARGSLRREGGRSTRRAGESDYRREARRPAREGSTRQGGAGSSRTAHTGTRRKAGPERSVTTNKPYATRMPSTVRARRIREQREAARRRRQLRAVAGIGIVVILLILLVFAIRGVAGCVAGVFGGGRAEKPAADETTTAVAKPDPVQIDLVMTGDILQHTGVFESGYLADGTRNYDHIFAHVTSELEGADIKVVNQETVLGGAAYPFSGYPSFNGPQEMGDAEAKVGFNVVLRATNHALDMGYEGLSSELSFWRTQHPEVAVIGAVDPNDATASIEDVYVFEKDGFKVALLNYTYDLNGYEDPRGVVSTLDEAHVRATVQKADELADMVVVFPHWGEEYNLEPVQEQYDMARIFMDCGADVIIGGHPHVIEPVEVLTASDGRKVPCFWSVGNFVSTQVENQNLIGGFAKVTLLKDSDGKCSVTGCSFVPTVTHKGIGANMTTYLLRDWTDTLASDNYLESNGTDNTNLTVAWADAFCAEVLGSGYDATTKQIVFGPEAFEPEVPTTVVSSGGGSGADAGETAEDGASADELPDAA